MARFATLVGIGLASTLMISAPVFAASPPASSPASAKPAMRAPTKQAAAPTKASTTAPKRAASAHPHARIVKVRLSNGKTVTYNCSLPGNKTKQACKG